MQAIYGSMSGVSQMPGRLADGTRQLVRTQDVSGSVDQSTNDWVAVNGADSFGQVTVRGYVCTKVVCSHRCGAESAALI